MPAIEFDFDAFDEPSLEELDFLFDLDLPSGRVLPELDEILCDEDDLEDDLSTDPGDFSLPTSGEFIDFPGGF